MGNSASIAGLTQDLLEDYVSLTYMSKYEIVNLLKKFYTLGPNEMDGDFHYRFPCPEIEELFLNLKLNPFKDRIFEVFSSRKDYRFSFEDMLDLCSVMSQNCPDKVKAKWAFKIFDFDNNEVIDEYDIMQAVDRLTQNRPISEVEKRYIAKTLLKTMDIQNTGSINTLEFEHAVGKMSEFVHTFSFNI